MSSALSRLTSDAGPPDSVLTAQSTFRAVLDAMASPGTVRPLAATIGAPAPLANAAAAVALTLCDHDTPVWLDVPLRASDPVCAWLRLHCGCRLVSVPADAAFAFVSAAQDLPPIDAFGLGTPDYPDRSTTIVIQVESLREGPPLVLSGPGIRDTQVLPASGLPHDMAGRIAANRALFPRGVDFILASANEIAALPRSVRLASDKE
jgi:alpha-D-ribose 1-methylphosphonate 5-triphosphate synthase subunit PhnH